MPRTAKEQVDITVLLQGTLNGYPGNMAIFREYLQNSDDAKATKQVFMLDERQHPVESLCDPSFRDSQGPAILAYNDGVLSERDWEALRTIHSSSKTTDEIQTGKNGPGFRASYFTDNPQVFSGKTLMILVPHHRFDERPGGISIDVVNEGANYHDQLKPFIDFMGDEFSSVSGTVFRLPLRTEKQAKESKIKNTPTSVEQIRTLLYDFCNVELEQVILFLKHITHIEICHVDPAGHRRVVGSVSIEDIVPPPSLREVKFRKITRQREDGSTADSRSWCYRSITIDKEEAVKVVSDRLGYDVGDSLIADKLLPSIELATPVNGGAITSSLFALLPLPIKTSFPVHVNAVFACSPDRQSLKNIEVGTIESRERQLVEWNKVIFEIWIPSVWADLLEELSSDAPWAVWPRQEKDVYWNNLTSNLVREVLRRNSAVFPAASGLTSFLSLDNSSVLISHPSIPVNLIRLLANLGVKIIQPPAHIFAILASDDISIAARILSPQTLHGVLEAGYQHDQWRPYDPNTVSEIIDYLVFSTSPPSLGNLIGLPWFVQPDESPLTFQEPGVGLTCIIPSSEEEARLFGSHLQMLAWHGPSGKLLSTLQAPGSPTTLNVTLLQPCHVMAVLSVRFTGRDAVSCGDFSSLEWISAFWIWLEGWGSIRQTILKVNVWKTKLSGLYLLPTTSGRLRRPSERVVHFPETASSIASAWEKLGVPLLHRDFSSRAIILLAKEGFIETPETPSFIPFLLQNADPILQHKALDNDFDSIRQSLYSAVIHQRLLPALAIDQKKVLEQLSIFSIRDAGEGPSVLKSINGIRIQISVSNDFPLPFQHPPVIYVDLGDPYTSVLIQMLEPIKKIGVLNLLCIAVDHWHLQSLNLQDRFIDLIFANWRKLPQETQEKLEDLPFVTVNGTQCRVPPKNLVHPCASLTPLFEGEIGRIPVGRFAAAPLVTTLQSLGFLPDSLDQKIVQDRLHYICKRPSQDQKIFDKAKTFVRLLDRQWEDSFDNDIRLHCNLPWLPQAPPSILSSPSNSRDQQQDAHSDPVFYDFVLTVLPRDCVSISNHDFRSALGWSDQVVTDILVRQLIRTISLPKSEDRYKRLNKLIMYMSLLHNDGQLSSKDLMSFRSEVTGRSWIPAYGSNTETVVAEHALFSGDLKPPFRHVHLMECYSFFMAMGCTKRPTLRVLVLELQKYDIVSNSDVPAVTALLQEIATYHPRFDRTTVSIPGQYGGSHPIANVYFCDTDCVLPTALRDKVPTHPSVSRSLSDELGIQLLSSLLLDLGEDEFDDNEQMGENLVDRIQGFLEEYDIKYAFNDFLANANDVHAKELSILLDRRRHPYKYTGLISPAFRQVQMQGSIIFFNDAVLSDEDFKCLRKVGRGRKIRQLDTHGRCGLSFYYFTDVVTVISGAWVMILDPSGRYLPANRGRKRTSLVRKLSHIYSQYPNQLQPYETLFKFSTKDSDTTFYQGTLFCLPLNTNISVKPCNAESAIQLLESSYRDLAHDAFFFTRLERISARIRTDETGGRYIWSFSAFRRVPKSLGDGLSYRLLEITSARERLDENLWIVATSDSTRIPENHKTTAMRLNLTKANVVVQLAIRLKSAMSDQMKFWLFSTLRLPRATSFPFHLNAPFAISSDRRSIVFDSPDSHESRDPKSDFNAWILTEVVPPLYLSCLTHVIWQKTPSYILPHKRWWILKPTDDISKHVSRTFLTLLGKSDSKVFKSTDGRLHAFGDAVFAKVDHDNLINMVVSTLAWLKAPRLITGYASTGLEILETARTMNEAYVRSVLSEMTLEKVRHLYMNGMIRLEDLVALLDYIRNETPLAGLPLLILSTNLLVLIPDARGQRIYFPHIAAHADLFESTVFLHPAFWIFEELWSSPSINVIKLTSAHAEELILDELGRLSDEGKESWLKKFWELYNTLPGPPSLSSLEAAGVKLVRGSKRHYSLGECQPDQVVYFANSDFRKELSPILHKLGIDTVKPTGSTELESYLGARFPEALVNVLMCLSAKKVTRFDGLRGEEAIQLRNWLTSSIETSTSTSDPRINRTHLSQLQIWPAHTIRGLVICSVSELAILPSFFSIKALMPYLRPNCLVAKHSDGLIAVKMSCLHLNHSSVTMSPQQILNSVEIPSMITGHAKMDIFGNLLRQLFCFSSQTLSSVTSALKIFDVDGRACPVQALYDHTVPLFSATLAYTSSFVHPRLRNLGLSTLRSFGLNHEISFTTFRTCVEKVQAALRRHVQDGTPTRDRLIEMSLVAFECYNNTLPHLIRRSSVSWAALDCIAFVRAKDVRRQGASYPADDFCTSRLPVLLAPLHCVLPSLEPIAWTQRALFFEEPNHNVTAVNTKLGVPEVHEVVAHLKILTTEIAPKHPGNTTLLSDIMATYKWLNTHAEEAREYMVLLDGEKLFLNVDNPKEDWWEGQWLAAGEMVLHLNYDFPNVKRVRGFLQDFAKLLCVAGCSTIFLPSRNQLKAVTNACQARNSDKLKIYDELRKGGEIIDIGLLPKANAPEELLGFSESGGWGVQNSDRIPLELTAHRVVLAAAIPYIRDWAKGWRHVTRDGVELVEFNGTFFGAKAVLDFIYTGDFNYTSISCSNEFEDLKRLLYELLALLPIADEWDMPDLKTKVESEIIHKHDLVQILLPSHEKMLQVAELFSANNLKDVLNEMARHNGQLLKRLSVV